MKKRLIQYYFFLLFLLLFDSCQLIWCSMFGIKTQPLSQENIAKKEKEYCINQKDIYIINAAFFTFLDSLDKNAADSSICEIIKNHCQPLQVMVFDSIGNICSYHINCYAGGFPNLKWKEFNTFPPITVAPIDTIITFDVLKNYIPHLQKLIEEKQKKYTVVIFWTAFMGRQSRRLIALMQKKIPKDQANLIYVNIENAFFQ